MVKTRDLFQKIRDTKGKFHANMDKIKDRNSKDLTEAEDTMKKWQEYTGELYKKGVNETDNHDGVITHLEPDVLKQKALLVLLQGPFLLVFIVILTVYISTDSAGDLFSVSAGSVCRLFEIVPHDW